MTVLLEPAGSAPTTLKDSSVTDAKLDTLAPQSMETADVREQLLSALLLSSF